MATHPDEPFAAKNNRSLASLFSELTREISDLVRQEIALARAEISEKLGQAGMGIALLAAGGVLTVVGLFFLVQALVFGVAALLSYFMAGETAAWVAPLLVGLLVVVIGWLLISRGRSNLAARNLMPRRTAESLHRDTEFAREQAERLRQDARREAAQ
jgi:hypothetical protein